MNQGAAPHGTDARGWHPPAQPFAIVRITSNNSS